MIHWHSFFFLLFALTACVFALAVVFTNNVVRMAFYLVLSLGATSGLFFLAGADFVGAMQLMIYVGGTLVLLVFGVMLTAQSPFISMKTRAGEWITSMIVGGLLLWVLLAAALNVEEWRAVSKVPLAQQTAPGEGTTAGVEAPVTASRLGLGLLGARVDRLEAVDGPAGSDPQVSQLAAGMSGYLLPFEIVSVHLLVVLVGAAYLARPKRRVVAGSHGETE
ncbi:MAG TPA: NADH-quinone oxidoreductase subunit J [Pirellulales bacterium]|nr:NADH-quinone oxidoreductase subunit J [Pirellulales bacterium]